MQNLPPINEQTMLAFLADLLNIPSPTGYTEEAVSFVEARLRPFPFLRLRRTRKGGLLAVWEGTHREPPRAVTAHVDTLGAMVKEIKPNGRLRLTRVGGFAWNTVEGEGCTVFASRGQPLRGAILLHKASGHVYGEAVNDTKRTDATMEVRLDARSLSQEQTRALGVEIGDFVAFDPRVEINNGFVRSRHLDDKACVANIVAAIESMAQADLRPARTTYFLFSAYEEVGHGAASGLPPEVTELLTLDMAAVGEGQASDEFHATLCLKDSGGPYHYGFNRQLRRLADEYGIPYKVDIYPYYGSDGEAAWRAGLDAAVALIGPGVDASHNYERTHTEALLATTRWLLAYLLSGEA